MHIPADASVQIPWNNGGTAKIVIIHRYMSSTRIGLRVRCLVNITLDAVCATA